MDAAAAAPGVGVTLEPPIISEIDIGGLALLTEALLDGQQQPTDKKEEDDAVALPLSTDEPGQPAEDNSELNKYAEEILMQNNVDQPIPIPSHQQLENAVLAPLEGVEPDTEHALANPIELRDVLIPTPVFVAQSGEHIHGQAQQGGDIAAYFALEFLDMQYIYYLQRSSVSLGRSSTLSHDSGGADIDLGPLKNISRLHARIEYEEEINGFVLAVIGRNGAFVDGAWIEPGRRVPLGDRTLVQISTRAFYFILPNSNPTLPDPAHLQSPEHEVPALDSTVTTAEDDDSHSTSASATPKQRIRIPRRPGIHHDHNEDDEDEDDLDEEVDIELHDNGLYHPIAGKGKGKGKEAMGPPKRGRGRPRKNPLLGPNATSKPKPKPRIRTPDDDEDDMAMMDILDDSEEDERDSGDDFVPKNAKRARRGGYGGGGKTRSGASTRPMGTTSRPRIRAESLVRPRSESVLNDEEMSESLEPVDDGDIFDDVVMDEAGNPLSPSVNKRVPKRKRELEDGGEQEGGPDKRRKSISSGSKPGKPKAVKVIKKEGGEQQSQQPKRKKAPKPEMKSLFTTTPAPSLSSVIASKESALAAEGGSGGTTAGADGDSKGKLGAGKKKDKGKSKKKDDLDGADEKDEEGEKQDGVGEAEATKKDLGPPPPKPPFTYPLLCYKALKALNGKAPYRAITKWLEQEYPYFAFATKEGKDGWENSTRHTLSSHRAFIKIDRKPEERGKGCFWSFDPEFEEQFKDQWMAAESQSRNPRPRPGPNAPGSSNVPGGGPMAMYPRPPFGPPPGGWSGVTPPHLMPGYRPVPGGSGQTPHPHPFPYPMGRPPIGAPGGPGGPVGPGGMPFPGPPFGPPPPPGHPMHGHHPPMGPPGGGGPGNMNGPPKARAPKKPKQALGAAFSRAPLIRPGLGGVPAKTDSASPTLAAASGSGLSNTPGGAGPSKLDELVMRGEHVARLAARVAKDELAGRAHPGAAMSVIMGGWGPPPPLGGVNGAAKGKMGMGRPPPIGTKTTVVLAVPPVEALPVMPSPTPPVKTPSESKDTNNDAASPTSIDKDKEKAVTSPSPTPAARPPMPIQMPIVFYDGKLYINPKAYPLVKEIDIQSLEGMPLGEVLSFLGGKAGVIPLGVAKPIPSGANAQGKEEKNAEHNGEDKAGVEAPASDSSEGSKTE